jgi:hypothetical protein
VPYIGQVVHFLRDVVEAADNIGGLHNLCNHLIE